MILMDLATRPQEASVVKDQEAVTEVIVAMTMIAHQVVTSTDLVVIPALEDKAATALLV